MNVRLSCLIAVDVPPHANVYGVYDVLRNARETGSGNLRKVIAGIPCVKPSARPKSRLWMLEGRKGLHLEGRKTNSSNSRKAI